ncbi:hypothetical protein V1517DRAFT_323630 [Lipomyces orientalis]|uniref:Uncharacterized protein n=1 Tax=Lipomyces orientalis TaxID=1233043 RepID=A0ACC3TMI8_9ASCO
MTTSNTQRPSSDPKSTESPSPAPVDPKLSDRKRQESLLSVPSGPGYLQAGYSSADPSEYESESAPEDVLKFQQPDVPGHQSPPTSPHGIQHRRYSWRHDHHSAIPIQDSRWRLYNPHPQHRDVSPGQERPKHHHYHYRHEHHKAQSQSDKMLPPAGSVGESSSIHFRTPTYDKSHYTFSAAGSNTRSLLEQDSKTPAVPPNERTRAQESEHYPGLDNESDTESDGSPPRPVFLTRRSSSNYQTELNVRRAQSRNPSDGSAESPDAKSLPVKALESRVSAIKIGGRDGPLGIFPPLTAEHPYRMIPPSHYNRNSKAHTFYTAEPTKNRGSYSVAPNESDEGHPSSYEESQMARSLPDSTSNYGGTIPHEIEDDLLRRKSADSDYESLDAIISGSVVEPVKGNEGSISPAFLFETGRTKSFDYNDYKSHFHGLWMSPKDEKQPGFSYK